MQHTYIQQVQQSFRECRAKLATEATSIQVLLVPDWEGQNATGTLKSAAEELGKLTCVMEKIQRLADEDD